MYTCVIELAFFRRFGSPVANERDFLSHFTIFIYSETFLFQDKYPSTFFFESIALFAFIRKFHCLIERAMPCYVRKLK